MVTVIAVVLVPLALLVTTCLLAALERRLVAAQRSATVADVVPLPGATLPAAVPHLDGDTLRLRRAA